MKAQQSEFTRRINVLVEWIKMNNDEEKEIANNKDQIKSDEK